MAPKVRSSQVLKYDVAKHTPTTDCVKHVAYVTVDNAGDIQFRHNSQRNGGVV